MIFLPLSPSLHEGWPYSDLEEVFRVFPFPIALSCFFYGSVTITFSAVTSSRVKCQDPLDPDTIRLSSPQKSQATSNRGPLHTFPTLIDEKVTKVIDSGHVIIN